MSHSLFSLHRFVMTASLALITSGCGPSIATLLAENRPREAMCRVTSVEDAQRVLPRILSTVRAEWRIRPIRREQVPNLDEEVARDVFDTHVFASLDVHLIDREGRAVDTLIEGPSKVELGTLRKIGGRMPFIVTDRSAFVPLTGEPGPTYITRSVTTSEPWRPIDLITLGAARLTAQSRTGEETVVSPDYDPARAAPRSTKLYEALRPLFEGPVLWVLEPKTTSRLDLAVPLKLTIAAGDCEVTADVEAATGQFDLAARDPERFSPLVIQGWRGDARIWVRGWAFPQGSRFVELEVPEPSAGGTSADPEPPR